MIIDTTQTAVEQQFGKPYKGLTNDEIKALCSDAYSSTRYLVKPQTEFANDFSNNDLKLVQISNEDSFDRFFVRYDSQYWQEVGGRFSE